MRRSADRILVTHTGSLPRPRDLASALRARNMGGAVDAKALAARVRDSVREVVARQLQLGVDCVDDGEHSKSSFTHYLRTRLSGLGRTDKPYPAHKPSRDQAAFSDVYEENKVMLAARPGRGPRTAPGERNTACIGPVKFIGHAEVEADIDNLRAALAEAPETEGFITSLSPNNLETHYRNEYYATEEEYLAALADAMREEYRLIVASGFILQVDDPRIITYWDRNPDLSLAECRKFIEKRVELLNYALRGIPEDRVRFHTCYSTNVAPRVHDLELKDYIDLMFKVRAAAYSIEASNPRHEHEWAVLKDVRLPDGKIIIPGVVSHCVSLVEHPELVAQRIERWAGVAGRENVIAGNDCGFATSAAGDEVHPDVAWAKMQALVDGARIASRRLWG